MAENINKPITKENRSDRRILAKDYYSVEFQVKGIGPIYQFKLWDESAHGLSILVKEGSSVLDLLQVDDILEMNFFKDDPSGIMKNVKTKIVHMTKQESGRFSGHFLIGLSTQISG